jgi:membrane-bound serine protease (ClpP class)
VKTKKVLPDIRDRNRVFLGFLVCLSFAGVPFIGALPAQDSATETEEEPKPAVASPVRSPMVVVIPIHEAIERGLHHMVERGVNEAVEGGVDLIILDIDTPGGTVDAAVDIKNLLLNASDQGIDTAAFVNPEAISAGALLALSTKKIFMTENGLIGDAAPVNMMGGGTGEELPEKIVSYVRSQFESVAQINGYPVNVVLAMVDPDRPVEGLTQEGELLTLTADAAVEYHIARQIVKSLDEAIVAAGYTNYEKAWVVETWSESVARFLTNPTITWLLITLGVLAFAIEFYTPGIGIPAAVAVCCFVVVFWGHTVAGLAGYESLLIFGIGVILLGVEIFVTPGFGVLGTLGLVFIFGSLVVTIMESVPWGEARPLLLWDLVRPVAMVGSSFLVGIVGMFVISLFLPRRWTFGRLTLAEAQLKEAGYAPVEEGVVDRVGEIGVATSALRPAGVGRFGDRRLDVVTLGDHIPRGTKIRIVRIEGRRVVVRRA